MKKPKNGYRVLSLLLSLVIMFSAFPLCPVFGAGLYSSDYHYWSQGASELEKMRKYGCWIVAQAKLLYETNVDRGQDFDPDSYYYWQSESGYVDSAFYQTNGGYAPVAYSKEKGKPLEYLGYFTATKEKLWENINNGLYCVVQVNNGSHYVYLDNETSLKKNKLYCMDSWSEQYSYGTRLLANYKKWDVCYVYKPVNEEDLLRPSMPSFDAPTSVVSCESAATFTWKAVDGAEGYRLRILDENGKSLKDETFENSFFASCALSKGKYTVLLTAYNEYGDSPENSLSVEAVEGITVTLDPNGGTCSSKQLFVTYGAAYGKLPKPTRAGYTFSGWYTAKTGGTKVTAKTVVKTAADHTLYARWSHTHAYTEKVTAEATCEKEGVKTFSCLCGDKYTEAIPATDHKYVAETKKATHDKDGLFRVYCANCDKTVYSSQIAKASALSLSKTDYAYTGEAYTPSVAVADSTGKTLYPGAHYNVTYENNILPGKGAAVIEFCGDDHEGSARLLFDILPATPHNVKTKQTAKTLTVSWSAVDSASGYRVSLYNKKGKLLAVEETEKTSFRFKELNSGTKYKVAVQAVGKSSDGAVCGSATKKLLTATKPAAPQKLVVTAGKGRAKLSWQKSFGATGYTVYYSTEKNANFKAVNVDDCSCTVKRLKSNTVYYFKVVANKTVGSQTLSSAFSVRRSAKVQ